MATITVRLSDRQFSEASQIGADRQCRAICRKLRNRFGDPDDTPADFMRHITGACGEAAVAIALGKAGSSFLPGGFWAWAAAQRKDPDRDVLDVGPFAVRYRNERPDLDVELTLGKNDNKNDNATPCVLVTGRPIVASFGVPVFRVRGWALAGTVRRLGERLKGLAAFRALPNRHLYPFPPTVADLLGACMIEERARAA